MKSQLHRITACLLVSAAFSASATEEGVQSEMAVSPFPVTEAQTQTRAPSGRYDVPAPVAQRAQGRPMAASFPPSERFALPGGAR